jgi:cephalosporin-C deacetylase-like acetyl esterase
MTVTRTVEINSDSGYLKIQEYLDETGPQLRVETMDSDVQTIQYFDLEDFDKFMDHLKFLVDNLMINNS